MQTEFERLMVVQSLDPAALAEYRRGVLPPAQRARLRGGRRIAGILLVAAIVPSALAVGLWAAGFVADASRNDVLGGGIGWTLLIGMFAAIALGGSWDSEEDARAGIVRCVDAVVTKSIGSGGRGGARLWITLGGERFDLGGLHGPLWSTLADGARYRVYYLPRTREVLAIEPAHTDRTGV